MGWVGDVDRGPSASTPWMAERSRELLGARGDAGAGFLWLCGLGRVVVSCCPDALALLPRHVHAGPVRLRVTFLQHDCSVVGAAGIRGAHRGSGTPAPARPLAVTIGLSQDGGLLSGGASRSWLPPMLSLLPSVGFPMIFSLMGVLGARLEPVAHMGGPALKPRPRPVSRGPAQGGELANGGVSSPW